MNKAMGTIKVTAAGITFAILSSPKVFSICSHSVWVSKEVIKCRK